MGYYSIRLSTRILHNDLRQPGKLVGEHHSRDAILGFLASDRHLTPN